MRPTALVVLLLLGVSAHADAPREWKPLDISRDDYLAAIEGVCRFTIHHQDANGAVIDPLLKREHQYSTPYFAFAVGTLVKAGRAKDLLDHGIRAMNHATACFARGKDGIPDNHGEFFIPCLTGALELYEGLVPADRLEQWRGRMKLPIEQICNGKTNNWRAYAMRGQWMRAHAGLIERDVAIKFVEDSWHNAEQRERIAGDQFNLYQDHQTDPESHAVEAVGRGNLLGLIARGYDGPAAGEIRKFVERGTLTTLQLQDPTGQCPPDGRADDHVFNDVLYLLCFDVMAERAFAARDNTLAGQYRRAAMIAFQSAQRWQRTDGEWAGSFYITKNHFDPADRVGYQRASNIGNYNGAVMLHLSEAYLARQTEIEEQPTPAELGGYAFATDPKFASAVANAGGLQMFIALRGDTKLVYDHYWTSLGVNRISRVGWNSVLGPSDGVRDAKTGRGVSFAPTWEENDKWVRMADMPERYAGTFTVQSTSPRLVRCAIDYAPLKNGDGPSFRHEFEITPQRILATLTSPDAKNFGVTWPLIESDGRPYQTSIKNSIATTMDDSGDQQCFIALDDPTIDASEEPIRSTYAWLRPVRSMSKRTIIYPRKKDDPPADTLLKPLIDESFDDANLHQRGWYDGERFRITDGALEYEWLTNDTAPRSSQVARHLFDPTDDVRIKFRLRLSKDFGWTNRNYHPHLIQLLTTENDKFAGPAATHLTVYVEPVNGKLRLAAQDIQNKDAPHGLTQGPLKGGYNGKFYDSDDVLLKDDAWHTIEAQFKLNTPGRSDGIVRGWFDDKLVIDRDDVILRSEDLPDMKFNQLLIAPYFGRSLLPHPQRLWIDDLSVRK